MAFLFLEYSIEHEFYKKTTMECKINFIVFNFDSCVSLGVENLYLPCPDEGRRATPEECSYKFDFLFEFSGANIKSSIK